jgi:hypothetical protein
MRALGVAICASLAFSGSAANGAGRGATLAIADRDPLTIRGARFAPNEKVKLLVSGQVQRTRSIRAGSRGGFRAVFRVVLGRCDALVVQALGNRGNRAHVDVTQAACAPPP